MIIVYVFYSLMVLKKFLLIWTGLVLSVSSCFMFLRVWSLIMNFLFVVSIFFVVILVLDYIKIILIMKEEEKILFLNLVVSLLPDFIALDVRHWIASQFALESNFGTSGFALCNNNFCGMKVPALRISLAVNSSDVGEFAQFGGITSCVHDYLLWLQANKFSRGELLNLDLFRKHIDISGYCPDLGYMDKINLIYNQFYDRTN